LYAYALQYAEHNTSSTSLVLRPEDKSSSDIKPFLRVVPAQGWQLCTCHLWRDLGEDEEEISEMRYPGDFALLLPVVKAKREDQVLLAKFFKNN